jgi:hypothetical protein
MLRPSFVRNLGWRPSKHDHTTVRARGKEGGREGECALSFQDILINACASYNDSTNTSSPFHVERKGREGGWEGGREGWTALYALPMRRVRVVLLPVGDENQTTAAAARARYSSVPEEEKSRYKRQTDTERGREGGIAVCVYERILLLLLLLLVDLKALQSIRSGGRANNDNVPEARPERREGRMAPMSEGGLK